MGDLPAQKLRSFVLLIALAASIATPCRADDLPDDLFARIDGEPIRVAAFEAFFHEYARSKLYHAGSPERLGELRREAADLFIERYLAAREAARRGIDAAPAVERELAAVEDKYRSSPDWPIIEPQLPEIRRQVTDSVRIDRLRQEVERVRDPSEAELRRFYRNNPQLFTEPERFHLKVILKLVAPSATADEWNQARSALEGLADDLSRGADFAQVAAKHSDHETAKAGGDLGFVHRGQLSEEAQAAVSALEPGQVSPPVRVLEGYALFRLDERLPEQLHSLPEVRERAMQLYDRETAARQWSQFVATLRANARIELSPVVVKVKGEESGTSE